MCIFANFSLAFQSEQQHAATMIIDDCSSADAMLFLFS